VRKDKRLLLAKAIQNLVFKASAGTGEDNTGANLTQSELLGQILRPDWAEGTIYARCNIYDVSDKANGVKMPIVKETVRTIAGGILGGFIAYPIAEGVPVTLTRGKLDQSTLQLNQVCVGVRVTNALLEDATYLEQYLSKGLEEALKYYLDYYILYGSGVTTCNGILDATGNRATGTVTMTSPFAEADYKSIVGKYYGGEKGCWVMSRNSWLRTAALYSSTFPLRFDDKGKAFLFGYPVIVKTDMASGGIVLGDFSQYFLGQKPMREEISEHLYFESNESVFRAIIRVNGMPSWYGGVITQDAVTTVYPFVAGA